MEHVETKKENKVFKNVKDFSLKYWWQALVSFGAVFLVGAISGLFNNTNSNWYNNLAKPMFLPEGEVFGIVWTILYVLLAVSLTIVLMGNGDKKVLWLYGVNFALQIAWNIAFFTFNSLFLGVVIMVLLIISAYLLLKELYGTNKTAFYLVIPYFVWLIFAFILNYSFYFLN